MIKRPGITFFTKDGCHLCEKAKLILHELQSEVDFDYEECDISQRDEWTEQYGLMIPVVMIDGEVSQFGMIDKTALLKRLHLKNTILEK